MKFFASLLLIITLTEAAPPPSQYEARPAGSMPCYLGCCKLNNHFFPHTISSLNNLSTIEFIL